MILPFELGRRPQAFRINRLDVGTAVTALAWGILETINVREAWSAFVRNLSHLCVINFLPNVPSFQRVARFHDVAHNVNLLFTRNIHRY